MSYQPVIVEHLTAFRGLLLLCCLGYWWILYAWLRPTAQAVRYAVLASLVQFWLGLLLDGVYVQLELWRYRPMPFTLAGVPLDLHLDWALLWGFGLVWLADRVLVSQARTGQVLLYLVAWTAFTVAFDAAMVEWLIFLEAVHPLWWLADVIFLTVIQGLTLWFYRSVGLAGEPTCGLGILPPLRPYLRALIYMSFALPCFFIYIPDQVEAAARTLGFEVRPTPLTGLPEVLILVALALGGWATHEFARRGHGTPIPWDPPRYLVVSGPYLFTTNAMQQAGLLLTLAVLLSRPSWVMFSFLVDVAVMAIIVFALFEPAHLRTRFAALYEAYRARVKPWRYTFNPGFRDELARPVVFYDANCGLCQTTLQILIALDNRHLLRFSPLDGQLAHANLPADYLRQAGDTAILWEPGLSSGDPGLISTRSRAVLRAIGYAPLPVSFLAALEGLPGVTFLADQLYRFIAAVRYKLWPSSLNRCLLLTKDERYLP
jgi:predicted DCC family thiol-disulfide oxidoreductase YuxK/protein-S-isoprenylcysteine O-methyltransferase Ste14